MVDTNKLIDFSIYMDSFRTQYINMEVAMTKAINAYKKALILNSIKKGVKALKSIKEVEKFCKEAFREEDLFSGHKGGPYIEGVVICVAMAFKMCEKLAKEKRIGNANKS